MRCIMDDLCVCTCSVLGRFDLWFLSPVGGLLGGIAVIALLCTLEVYIWSPLSNFAALRWLRGAYRSCRSSPFRRIATLPVAIRCLLWLMMGPWLRLALKFSRLLNQQCVDLGTCRVCSCGVTPRALCRMAIWIVKSVCRVLGRGFLGGVRRVFVLEPLCIPKACLWGSLLIFDALQWLRSVLRHCRRLPCPATSGIAHQIAAVRSPWILMRPFVIGHRPRFACMHLSYLRHCLIIARGRHVVTYRVSASLRTCCTCCVLQPLTLSPGLPYRSKAEASFLYRSAQDFVVRCLCLCYCLRAALRHAAFHALVHACQPLMQFFMQFFDFFSIDTTQYFRYACRFMFHDAADPGPKSRGCCAYRLFCQYRAPESRVAALPDAAEARCSGAEVPQLAKLGRSNTECPALNHPSPPPSAASCHYFASHVSHPARVSRKASSGCKHPRWCWPLFVCLLYFQLLCCGAAGAQAFTPENQSSVRKRAFRRACARAERFGWTMYRGRILRASAVPQDSTRIPPTSSGFSRGSTSSDNSDRLCVYQWNAGGLVGVRYQEFRARLATQPTIQVAVVVETQWQQHSEWEEHDWIAVHHGSGQKKQGGLLVLLRKTHFRSPDVRHSPVIPGRIMHLRAHGRVPLDLVACYQHVFDSSRSQVCLDRRVHFWNKLHRLLDGCPKRHSLIILGDFNTSLTGAPRHLRGPCTLGTPPPDAEDFHTIMETHGLYALNTHVRKQVRTYIPHSVDGKAGTQIDFFLVRVGNADRRARLTWTLPNFPLQVHVKAFKHIPLLASVRFCREVFQPKPDRPFHQAAVLLQRVPGLADRYREALREEVHKHPLDEALTKAWRQVAPPTVPAPTVQLSWQQPATKGQLQLMWTNRAAYVALRAQYGGVKPAIFMRSRVSVMIQLWRHFVSYQRAHRALQARSRNRHNERIQRHIAAAQQAIDGDRPHILYGLIKKLAPRMNRTRLQIRSQEGHILTASQEVEELRKFFGDLYMEGAAAFDPSFMSRLPLPTADELHTALRHLPVSKASLPSAPPAALWAVAADILAPVLHDSLQAATTPAEWPALWHWAHLYLMAKKPSAHRPEDLRPISLLHPVAKSFAWALNKQVLWYAWDSLASDPQYAYLQGRGVDSALDSAFLHCHEARMLMKSQIPNVFDKRAGKVKHSCCGAITLSLDMAKAFDKVDWARLHNALLQSRVPEPLAALIISVHRQVQMRIMMNDIGANVDTRRGLRQGCTLAPTLWNIYVHHLLDELRRRITHEAVNQHTTVFADDFLLQKIFVDRAGLLTTVGMFEQLLSVIRLFGLDCSYDKSAVLVVTQGYAGQREFRSLCVPHPEHKWCLRLKVDDILCDTPVRAVHKYLGAQLSYRAQQKHTLEYRVQCARTAFSRLWRFVRCMHVPLDRRVQLWRVYVRTTLFYSLSSCGLDCAGPTRIVGLAAKHLRLISRLPAHITRIDNHALFKRLQVEHPLQTLTRMAEARHTRLLNAPPGLARDDKLATWRHDILQQLRAHSLSAGPPAPDEAAVSSNPASVRLMPAPCTQVVTCHLCGQTFPNTPALRQHITRSHDASHTSTTAAHDAQDRDSFCAHAKDGMPCCRHCNKAFSGWPQFRVHIQREACPVLHGFVPAIGHLGHATPQVPSSASGSSEPRAAEARLNPYFVVPEVVSAAKAGWLDVTATAYVQEKSVNHCLFCFQWCKKGYVQHHVQSQHKDSLPLVQRAFEVCRAERRRLTAKRSCPFCNQTVDAAARHCIVCPVLTTSVWRLPAPSYAGACRRWTRMPRC